MGHVYAHVYPNTIVQINWVEEISNSRTNLWYQILHRSYSKGKQISYVFSTFYEEILEVKKTPGHVFFLPCKQTLLRSSFLCSQGNFSGNEIQFVIKK